MVAFCIPEYSVYAIVAVYIFVCGVGVKRGGGGGWECPGEMRRHQNSKQRTVLESSSSDTSADTSMDLFDRLYATLHLIEVLHSEIDYSDCGKVRRFRLL